ncbi:helix-turn-helix domain-containing protein [Diplocloster modestus]|uniref:Helix-turn-helix transcriptional regulator n=1 Tax=Diplocloster modestus TaxID=2850322 RepID=A0ABS6KCS7_9FIRM|nr:helix-turn-helix transcriptional regulator [Diplocloster modestus]MBU9728303.1 helix-turn-helix transcriptional regulator [Diplocloster modestus]
MIRIMLSRKLGELRLTQADLSRKTGIRANTINELYHEMTDRVSLEQLDLICEALGCSLDELVDWTPNPVPLISKTRTGNSKKDIV